MFTKFTLKAAAVAAFAMSFISPVQAQEAEYNWRLHTIASETSVFFQHYAVPFAENVALFTNGQVNITPVPAGVIAPAFKGYEAVQDGLVEMASMYPGYLINEDPVNALLSAFPGGMGPDAYLAWLYDGGGRELWEEFRREKMGLHALIVGSGPSEIHMHSHKPVRTIEDLKGLKIRTAGAFAQIANKLGASTVTVPGSEIFGMLERKGIDAAEWVTPSENVKVGFNKVAKYIIMPGVHAPSNAFDLVMRADVWDALPDDIKKKIDAAARLTTYEAMSKWEARDIAAMADLKAGNNEIVYVDQNYIDTIRAEGRIWAEENSKDNEWMAKISASYFAFMDAWSENATIMYTQKN